MERHFKATYKILELLEESWYRDFDYNNIINLFMTDERVTKDMILLLYSRYYIKNKVVPNNNNKEQDIIIKFIEKRYQNSERLISAFYSNYIVALKLLSNYIHNSILIKEDFDIIDQLKKRKMLEKLDPYYDIISVEYINDIIREKIRNKMFADEQMDMDIRGLKFDLTDSPKFWMAIILFDAYIIGKHLYRDKDYAFIIEENDFETLVDLFKSDIDFYEDTIDYMIRMQKLDIEPFIKLFDTAETNKQTYQTIKKINPFYLLDKINIEDKRKFVKSLDF